MEETLSAEEVKKEQITIMGFELGSLYNKIYCETIWLNYNWNQFDELYGIEEARIKIMNHTAPFFFSIIQKILWEHIILGIVRLANPQERNSIHSIPKLITDKDMKELVETKVDLIQTKANFTKDWKDEMFNYHNLTVSSIAISLKKANKLMVNEVLNEIKYLINILHEFYFMSEFSFSVISGNNGAKSLIYTLDDGLRERENYFTRMNTRNIGYNKYPGEL